MSEFDMDFEQTRACVEAAFVALKTRYGDEKAYSCLQDIIQSALAMSCAINEDGGRMDVVEEIQQAKDGVAAACTATALVAIGYAIQEEVR